MVFAPYKPKCEILNVKLPSQSIYAFSMIVKNISAKLGTNFVKIKWAEIFQRKNVVKLRPRQNMLP